MKKQKMLITLAGLVAVVATSATITAYSLAGDGSNAPVGESLGTIEPAFQDDKIPTFDPRPDTIYDGKGGVSVTNPDIKVDDPPAGKVLPDNGGVVPIGKFDSDPPLHGDPEPVDRHKVPADKPNIEPVDLPKVPADKYAQVLELAKLDMADMLGLADIDPIRLVKIGKAEWNISLGNPQPGIVYADVLVPGFKMLLEADGAFYTYHTSLDEAVFVDNPDTGGGAIGFPDPSGTWPKDNPPTDDMTDTPPLHGDPPPPVGRPQQEPVDGNAVPDISRGHRATRARRSGRGDAGARGGCGGPR